MPQLLIALRRDEVTGKQNIIVKLDRDADALPIEHEALHRALVEKLIGTGLDAASLGEIIVEREGAKSATETTATEVAARPIARPAS